MAKNRKKQKLPAEFMRIVDLSAVTVTNTAGNHRFVKLFDLTAHIADLVDGPASKTRKLILEVNANKSGSVSPSSLGFVMVVAEHGAAFSAANVSESTTIPDAIESCCNKAHTLKVLPYRLRLDGFRGYNVTDTVIVKDTLVMATPRSLKIDLTAWARKFESIAENYEASDAPQIDLIVFSHQSAVETVSVFGEVITEWDTQRRTTPNFM